MARVLLVNKASFDYPGGAEARIGEVAGRWVEDGHEVFMVCAKTSLDEPAQTVLNGVVIRCVKVMPDAILRRFPRPHYLPQTLFYIVGLPFLLYYIRRWRIDAIRDSMSPFPGLSLLAPFFGRRGIVVVHNLFGGFRGWRTYYPWYYALAGAVAEWFLVRGWFGYRTVVTDSPWLARYIGERSRGRVRVRAIENGVESERIPQRPRRGHIRRMMNAARLTEHKRQADLVEACRRLQAMGLEFELDLYGGGNLESSLRAAIEKGRLETSVKIHPALPHEELLQRFQEYDLFVMASYSEGLPVVMLEAMAACVPVVVAARPYATELLNPSIATFFDPEDPEGLTSTLARVIREPDEAEAKAARGRRWVEKFTWARVAQEEWRLIEGMKAEG